MKWAKAVLLAVAVTWLEPMSAQGQVTRITAVHGGRPDSVLALVHRRLARLNYQIEVTDSAPNALLVRRPGADTHVRIIVEGRGDSSRVSAEPGSALGANPLGAVLAVMHDATTPSHGEEPEAPTESDALPTSRWRPELYVTPAGRGWLATGGLYTADSISGRWRRLAALDAFLDRDDVRIGARLAFVSEDTVLLGMGFVGPRSRTRARLFRTDDGGASWEVVAIGDYAEVDEVAALGASVWAFATRFESGRRRTYFLLSRDGGVTWTHRAIPEDMNDITGLVRVSPLLAYGSTAGRAGPAFWATEDGGETWTSVPTPHDQGVHTVPSYGVRVEEIAVVGPWLAVREYGRVFVTRRDTIAWRALDNAEHVASDRTHDRLFVVTEDNRAAWLDARLEVVQPIEGQIPPARPTNIEKILAWNGLGFVSMSHGDIYVARDGWLQRLVAGQRPSAPPN